MDLYTRLSNIHLYQHAGVKLQSVTCTEKSVYTQSIGIHDNEAGTK